METSHQSLAKGYIWHFKRLMIFGIPLVFAQVLQMSIGFTDAFMVGRLGEVALAQIGQGAQFVFFLVLLPVGLSVAVSILCAQALAQENYSQLRKITRAALWIHLVVLIGIWPLMFYSGSILTALNQPDQAIEGAQSYIRIIMISMPFIYASTVLKSYLTALERGNEILIVSFAGFLFNAAGNYVLIYGHLGFPALGLIGSAIASVLTNIFMFFAVLWYCLRDKMADQIRLFTCVFRIEYENIRTLVLIGLPITLGILSEVGLFQLSTYMIGWISLTSQAAHTIVLSTASMTFMIPLGLSMAASVRAGNAEGRGDLGDLIKGSVVAYIIVTLIMCLTALLFWFFPEIFIQIFIDLEREDAAQVAKIAASMFVGAALFQIFDGAQVIGISVLRGIKDVFVPAVMAFVAYWLIGAPLSYWFGISLGLGGAGVWFGLAAGLAVASVMMLLRLRYQILLRLKG